MHFYLSVVPALLAFGHPSYLLLFLLSCHFVFKLVDVQVGIDYDTMLLTHLLHCDVIPTNDANATLQCTSKGWDKNKHINWFDKTLDPMKFRNNPPP